jgi:hypothetical protein
MFCIILFKSNSVLCAIVIENGKIGNGAYPSFNSSQDKTNLFLSPNEQRNENRVQLEFIACIY